ncbi:SAM-dependent methyltransferase [Streptomonospora wellingtoniae]|uniref:SAM-dependent methyltransferase n=1 Tax=Streptomonospora wellingtoniae TaxID=3075544 RepID=A0ABU2KUT1_9ACTN|nr:SAM-dependent methyltransferase [Streptomonospora sp. DSM 45055]MDT0303055.1 SAM-dependent methyltransferase [Streptomonospora sp. DSM 45055]
MSDALRFPPTDLDMSKPTIARAYDALLGGKDNFAPDRELAAAVEELNPGMTDLAIENRGFLSRGVQYVANELGIDQFLDLGSGLPTVENTHQVAQRNSPGNRVVYVDIDPMVLAHARALMVENETTTVITADLRDVEKVLGDPGTRRLLTTEQPVCLMLVSLLHCIPDEDDPFDLVRSYLEPFPSGSALVYSHLCADDVEHGRLFTERVHASGAPWGRVRDPRECAAAVADLELVSPSVDGAEPARLVDCDTWRKPGTDPVDIPGEDKRIWEHAGVAVKP